MRRGAADAGDGHRFVLLAFDDDVAAELLLLPVLLLLPPPEFAAADAAAARLVAVGEVPKIFTFIVEVAKSPAALVLGVVVVV